MRKDQSKWIELNLIDSLKSIPKSCNVCLGSSIEKTSIYPKCGIQLLNRCPLYWVQWLKSFSTKKELKNFAHKHKRNKKLQSVLVTTGITRV